MTPPSPSHEGTSMGRSLHLHIDRRRMIVLGTAGAFLVIAIVFGGLAYFQTSPTSGSSNVSATLTATYTVTPPAASSPAAGETTPPGPVTSAVVTVTSTRIVSVPQASAGSSLGAIESGASTLSTVVAAACAVIALRPHGRRRPPAPPAPAAAADAPASTPGV
ncbi:MAG TPA: hypothetical protein VIX15_14245 [Streptosporangiaceae bacterium]